jgi:hypothetical protein
LVDFPPIGAGELRGLEFTEVTLLRRLKFRMLFPQISTLNYDLLLGALSTITSPVFCQFALELYGYSSRFGGGNSMVWDGWKKVDRFLEERFASRGEFSFIIRTGKVDDRETFERQTKEVFPLLVERGCAHFEISA